MNKVLISGITGQDASYLADYYLADGAEVIGLKRRSSTDNEWRLEQAKKYGNKFKIVECDITDPMAISGIVSDTQPDIFMHTAAQSHVATSFTNPRATLEANTVGTLNCLEAIKNTSPHTRLLHTGTSEQFGANYDIVKGKKVQNENTRFDVQSPYAVSKVAAYDMVRLYRKAYGLFVSNAISFNHGGPRRGDNFIEMKIGKWIKNHRSILHKNFNYSSTQFHSNGDTYNKLRLGNLDAYRDFTDARDIVRGLVKIAAYNSADDFVLCSGDTVQIRDLVEIMFEMVGVKDWERFVYIDPEFFRPAEVDYLRGDASKANELLNWKPEIGLEKMCWDIIYV